MNITTYCNGKAFVVCLGEDSLFFSYSTLVAYRGTLGRFRTDMNHSRTTSRHHAAFGTKDWPTRPQEWFDNLEASVVQREARRILGS